MLKIIAWTQILLLGMTAHFLLDGVASLSETRSSAMYLWALIFLLGGIWWVSWLSDSYYRRGKAITDLMTNVLVIVLAAASVPLLEVDVIAVALITLYILRQVAIGVTTVVVPAVNGIQTVRASTLLGTIALFMMTVVLVPIP